MTLSARVGGSRSPIQKLSILIPGAMRPLVKLSQMVGGQLRLIYSGSSGLSLSISPSPAQSHADDTGTAQVFVTATPSGGLGPFSYRWSITSFMGETPVFDTPSFASAAIRQSGLNEFDENDCVARCDITDSLGAMSFATVPVTFFGPIDRGDTR